MGAVLSNAACYAVGYLYPSYAAYRALQRNSSNAELVERLATWAVVVSLLHVIVKLLDPLLGFWFPFYHPAKVVLFIWLVAPGTRGGVRLFVKHVEPALTQLEAEIAAARTARRSQPDEPGADR